MRKIKSTLEILEITLEIIMEITLEIIMEITLEIMEILMDK